MCECILSDTLQGKIPLNSVLKWLSNQKLQDRNLEELEGRKCCQGDFISFFLNFIHDARVSADKSCDFIQSTSTPKRIERFTHKCESERSEIKRRPALFGDAKEPEAFSTPKRVLNESYASPISPLYKPDVTPKTFHQKSNLCLGDFITPKLSKKKVQRKLQDDERGTRRINPTNLMNAKCNSSFRRNDNSFNFENETGMEYCERSSLMEECMRIQRSSSDVTVIPICKNMITKREVVPVLKLVTFKEQLDILTVIYSFMLDHNFVLNLTSELHFIISLLLSKEYEEDDNVNPNDSLNLGVSLLELTEEKLIFKTVHNRAYFASNILRSQLKLLQILDRSTLRLLVENKRFQHFSSEAFVLNLLVTIEGKNDSVDLPNKTNQNVCFISDTDNRDNFPNDPSFHAFRKQRDMFYETLRIWENNHLHEEWNFTVALGGKIKALLNMYPDPANLVHFARLFKAQLLMNSSGKTEEDFGENQLGFLSSIPNIDAEKLQRLKNRIVGKQTGSGMNSIPVFSGYQEFYKDFLLVAANHIFNRHLKDALITEIVELDETKFTCSDFDDSDGLDATTKNAYVLCVTSLRTLAKFLGFVESLPYKSDYAQVSQNVISCHIGIRNEVQPNLNLKKIIEKSRENKMLILTIPWVTKYLAMLDYVTLRLSCFKQVHHCLFEIYHNLQNDFRSNALLMKLCLGWLFELPHFPEDLYYPWLSERLTRKNKNAWLLGELNIVDQNVIYICCPFLQEIKKVLSSDSSFSNGNTIKHITPLTAVESASDLSKKRLRLQLEEAFFNGQPVSMRKTVEFVSERVASACVKEICNEIVPDFKKKSVAQLKQSLNSLTLHVEDSTKQLHAKSAEVAASCLKVLREEIDEKLKSITGSRIPTAIEALLASDVLQQTKDVCVTITNRVCLERVQQWVNSHVNMGVFTRDFDAEVKAIIHSTTSSKAKPVFSLPEFGKDIRHDETALSGYKLVDSIRSYSWMVLEKAPRGRESLIDLLQQSHRSITARCDLNGCILALINKLLLDLALLLIAHNPEFLTGEAVSLFLSIWRESKQDGLFDNLVCPRNASILNHSHDANVWRTFRRFTDILVRENFVTYDKLTVDRNS